MHSYHWSMGYDKAIAVSPIPTLNGKAGPYNMLWETEPGRAPFIIPCLCFRASLVCFKS